MDNFDHEEDTKSGTGGSHDTVLVLSANRETYSMTLIYMIYC